jgi:putative membrane protein
MNYRDMKPEDLTLPDLLARDRTVLANERTLLAYVRTAFGFVAGGVTLIKLFPEDQTLLILGIGLIATGFVVAVVGLFRFWSVARRLKSISRKPVRSQDV